MQKNNIGKFLKNILVFGLVSALLQIVLFMFVTFLPEMFLGRIVAGQLKTIYIYIIGFFPWILYLMRFGGSELFQGILIGNEVLGLGLLFSINWFINGVLLGLFLEISQLSKDKPANLSEVTKNNRLLDIWEKYKGYVFVIIFSAFVYLSITMAYFAVVFTIGYSVEPVDNQFVVFVCGMLASFYDALSLPDLFLNFYYKNIFSLFVFTAFSVLIYEFIRKLEKSRNE